MFPHPKHSPCLFLNHIDIHRQIRRRPLNHPILDKHLCAYGSLAAHTHLARTGQLHDGRAVGAIHHRGNLHPARRQQFLELQKKCESAEISSKALDLRGLLDALRLIRRGVSAGTALDMGITNKAFDAYEQSLIRDVIAARIPAKLDRSRLFTD